VSRAVETAGAAHFGEPVRTGSEVVARSIMRSDAIALGGLLAADAKNALIPKLVRGLLDARRGGRWANTLDNAFAILALERYLRTFEAAPATFEARTWVGNRYLGAKSLSVQAADTEQLTAPMPILDRRAGGANVTLAKQGKGRLYYRVGLRYAAAAQPALDHGFALTRSYRGIDNPADVRRDPDGTWRIKAGAQVEVRVSVVAPSVRNHVAIVDPLPAGLEAVDWLYWDAPGWTFQSLRDRRVEAFASGLGAGVRHLSYIANATTPGSFRVDAAHAEEMYAPETFGRTSVDRVIVE